MAAKKIHRPAYIRVKLHTWMIQYVHIHTMNVKYAIFQSYIPKLRVKCFHTVTDKKSVSGFNFMSVGKLE